MTACPRCGLGVSEGDLYCQYCGERISFPSTEQPLPSKAIGFTEKMADPRKADVSKKRTGRKKKQQTKVEKTVHPSLCPSCGLQVPQTLFFCPHCNFPLVEGTKQQVQHKTSELRRESAKDTSGLIGKFNLWISTRNERVVRNLTLLLVALILLLATGLILIYF
jgi:uncharacterized membrane protein YvbJ